MTLTKKAAASSSQSPQKQSPPPTATPTAPQQQLQQTTCSHTEYSTMAPSPGMRRKNSLGPLRRAHPASGATWNVEVIRGKMTSRCLWHACRALVLGLILMVLGAGMATIGYYAVPLSTGQLEKGSNSTAFIKNISRGYHLNNLSYIGPIVMGFGGFIVVAACVMTFEARDSAAKVVPARFKMSTTSGGTAGAAALQGGSGRGRTSSAIRRAAAGTPSGCSGGVGGGGGVVGPSSVGSQTTTTRWDRESTRESAGGAFRASPGDKYPDRQALTAALIHFSRALGTPKHSPASSRRASTVSRSGSVPNLHDGEFPGIQSPNRNCFLSKGVANGSGATSRAAQQQHGSQKQAHHQQQYHPHHRNHTSGHHRRSGSRHSSLTKHSTREHHRDRFLHPGMLKYHRQAISVDESNPPPCLRPILSNSRQSVLLGSHPAIGSSTSPTHESGMHRQIKRSDTAKAHVLARQKNIEKEEHHHTSHNNNSGQSPKALHSQFSSGSGGRRRSSTASDASMAHRPFTVSRTPSMDSRSAQVVGVSGEPGGGGVKSTPPASSNSPRNWRVSAQISTPSVEKEFRSQLSICSEPAIASSSSPKALSCQSSIEPCVPEEDNNPDGNNSGEDRAAQQTLASRQRPDTLILDCSLTGAAAVEAVPSKYLNDAQQSTSRSFKRKQPSRKAVQKNASVAEIYFITSAEEPSKDYDSIEVIDERRNKSFGHVVGGGSVQSVNDSQGALESGSLERTDTVIYRDGTLASNEQGDTLGRRQGPARDGELTKDTNAANTMTIMAEIEQRRSSNVSEADT